MAKQVQLTMENLDLYENRQRVYAEGVGTLALALGGLLSEVNRLRCAVREREAVAMKIIELARRGERNPDQLRDRILREAGLGTSG